MLSRQKSGADRKEEGKRRRRLSCVISWEWKRIPGRGNSVSKGSEMEKCKVCVVNDKEPKVTVTDYAKGPTKSWLALAHWGAVVHATGQIMSLSCFQILQDCQLDFKIQTPYHVLQDPIAGVHKLQPTGQFGAPPTFVNSLVGTQPWQLIHILSMGLSRWSWVAETETIQPSKPKILLSGPLQDTFANLCP